MRRTKLQPLRKKPDGRGKVGQQGDEPAGLTRTEVTRRTRAMLSHSEIRLSELNFTHEQMLPKNQAVRPIEKLNERTRSNEL
jgi:hypothetical protein